jgi:DNA polymerase
MATSTSAAPWVPPHATLERLRQAAAACQGCELYQHATQTVFGEGRAQARLVLVGEQPGDSEDRQGHPFVGPAGRLLDKCLVEAGIDRSLVYVTNAVKHFKFQMVGHRRLHKKPSNREVAACHPWLLAELEQIAPDLIVALGATAAQAMLGKDFKVTQRRGEIIEATLPGARAILATVHPSSLLRAPDDETRELETRRFIADLEVAARFLAA